MRNKEIILPISFVVLYLFIFNPIIAALPIAPLKLSYPFFFILYFMYRNKMAIVKGTEAELKPWLLVTAYSLIIPVFCSTSISEEGVFPINFFSIFELLFIPYIISYVLATFLNKKDFVQYIGYLVLVAASLSILCLVSPPFNNWVKFGLGGLQQDDLLAVLDFRGFGVADNLLYGYSILMGFVFAYCLLIKKGWYWTILLFMALLCVLINARTGMTPVVLALIFAAMLKKSKIIKMAGVGLIILFVFLEFGDLGRYQATIDFVLDGYNQSVDLVHGEATGSMEGIFREDFALPTSLMSWIFGGGKRFLKGSVDVGYLQQLYYGGIIYILLLLNFILIIFKKIHRFNNTIAWVFLITVLFVNWKGSFMGSNCCLRLVMVIYYYNMITMKKYIQIPSNVSKNVYKKVV